MSNLVLSTSSTDDGHPAVSVDALVQAWANAWNTHDMEAATRLVAVDIDFVTVAGLG